MFACDDNLKVDLEKLAPMGSRASTKPPSGNSMMGSNQIENQWKFYMQKSLKNLVNDLLRGDETKDYICD